MASVEKFPDLLTKLPKGAWVALSHNEDRVITYGAELPDVIRQAQEGGEDDPVVTRVPLTEAARLH